MVTAHFDFIIENVPDEATADDIARSIRRVLNEDFSTDIWIVAKVSD